MIPANRVRRACLSRPLTVLLLLFIVALSGSALFALSRLSRATSTAVGSGRVQMTLDRRFAFAGQCVTLRWTTDHIQSVTLNDQVVALSGTAPLCPVDSELSGVLKVVSQDNTRRIVSLNGYVLFRSDLLILALPLGLFLIAALISLAVVGDLPLVSGLGPIEAVRAYAMPAFDGLKAALCEPTTRRDLRYAAFVIGLAVIPLLVLRTLLWSNPDLFALISLIAFVIVGVVVYKWRTPHSAAPISRRLTSQPSFIEMIGISALLLFFTVIAYDLPMKSQYWRGGDEARIMAAGNQPDQIVHFDQAFGRPVTGLWEMLGVYLAPGSVYGFMWLAVIECFLSAVLLYALLRHLFKDSGVLPVLAALLFIVNPAEPARYLVIFMFNYYPGVLFALLSLYMFLRAWDSGSRGLLVLSSAAFGMSALCVEAVFPLSPLWVILLWITTRRDRRQAAGRKDGQFLVWCLTLTATVLVLAARAVQTGALAGTDETYQTTIFSRFKFRDILQHLLDQLIPTLRFIRPPTISNWLFGIVVVLAAFAVLLLMRPLLRRSQLPRRTYGFGILFAGVAILLSVVLYLAIETDTRFMRTQFFTAPAQAVFWALLFGGVSAFFPRRVASVGVLAGGGLLILVSSSGALALQDTRYLNSNVTFDKVAHVIQQVHQLSPSLQPQTAIVFILPDSAKTPIGSNYAVQGLFQQTFGVDAYQVNYTDNLQWRTSFDASGLINPGLDQPLYPYEQLVAFSLTEDGRVSLLQTLPASALPPGVDPTGRYNPQARIRSDPHPLPALYDKAAPNVP